jgi:hypothetical protein
MKSNGKGLVLKKETLRNVTRHDLRNVVGASPGVTSVVESACITVPLRTDGDADHTTTGFTGAGCIPTAVCITTVSFQYCE